MPEEQPETIRFFRGDTDSLDFVWEFPEGEAPDIGGYKAILTVKPSTDLDNTDSRAVIRKVLEEGAFFSKEDDEITMIFPLAREDTLDLERETYILNARLADENGNTVMSTENIYFEIEIGSTQGINDDGGS